MSTQGKREGKCQWRQPQKRQNNNNDSSCEDNYSEVNHNRVNENKDNYNCQPLIWPMTMYTLYTNHNIPRHKMGSFWLWLLSKRAPTVSPINVFRCSLKRPQHWPPDINLATLCCRSQLLQRNELVQEGFARHAECVKRPTSVTCPHAGAHTL